MTTPESGEFFSEQEITVTYPDAINLHTVLNRAKIPHNRFADTDLLDVILGNKRARKKKEVEMPSSSGVLSRFKAENDPLIGGQITTVHLIPPNPRHKPFNYNLIGTLVFRKDQPPPEHNDKQIQSLLAHLKNYGLQAEELERDLPPGLTPLRRVLKIGTYRLELPIPLNPSQLPVPRDSSLNFYMKKEFEEVGVPTVILPERCANTVTTYADTYGKVLSSWYKTLGKRPSFSEIILRTPARLTMDEE